MMWQECDERAHIIDSLENGDFEMDKQFIRVSGMVVQVSTITAIDTRTDDGYADIYLIGRDRPIKIDADKPDAALLIAWATDPVRCIDVMAPEPTIDTPNVVTDASGIRWEV